MKILAFNERFKTGIEKYELEGIPLYSHLIFNKINLLVGENNSGKSQFMRILMKLAEPYYFEENIVININNLIKDINSHLNDTFRKLYNFKDIEFIDLYSSINLKELIESNRDKIFYFIDLLKSDENIKSINDRAEKLFSEIFVLDNPVKKYYIPTLRSSHSLYNINEKINEDIFSTTLSKYYDLSNEKVEVFTGQSLYKEILNARNSEKKIRKAFEDFEKFLSESFFGGKNIDLISHFDILKKTKNNLKNEVISLYIKDEEERQFYELGDGIQAIIILMYKIFIAEDNSFIFIDEPELNLHPGMQRLFLEQITSNKSLTDKNLTYFIATHSNHFLDLTIQKDEVSVFSFSKIINREGESKFNIKNVNAGDNRILRDLGVNNSSVFLANCSIWVEGISDRNYIKAFLIAYCRDTNNNAKYPKEDIDFAFFEYAGGNIEHYIFGEYLEKHEEERILQEINTIALSNNIFLFADSDLSKEGTKKDDRLKNLEDLISKEKIYGKIFRNIRESENLLSKEVWKKILIEFCNKASIHGNETKIQEKIIQKIDKLELEQDKYIGSFLKKIKTTVDELNEVCKKNQNGIWQTFRDKAELSRVILKKTVDGEIIWDDFKEIPEVVELTESVYNFIRR